MVIGGYLPVQNEVPLRETSSPTADPSNCGETLHPTIQAQVVCSRDEGTPIKGLILGKKRGPKVEGEQLVLRRTVVSGVLLGVASELGAGFQPALGVPVLERIRSSMEFPAEETPKTCRGLSERWPRNDHRP